MDNISMATKPTSLCSKAELCSLLLALLIFGAGSETAFYNVFLNSYGHCGHTKTFEVRPDRGYVVRADISPNTGTKSFMDCETSFYSEEEDGKLCVIQEGRMNEIDDLNAELLVHDGYDTHDSPIIFSLKQGSWVEREYCTKSRYVNFYLRKIDKTANVDIRKVFINLKILDIESRDRRLYMEDIYCDRSYQLQNSLVSIYNRALQGTDLSAKNLTNICSLKMEKQKNDNRSICFVYVPSDRVACSSNWIISVFSDLQNMAYKLSCHDQKAKQLHAWCGSNKTHSVTLNLLRADNITWDSPLEFPEMFRYIFADFQGSPESLLEKVKRELLPSTENDGLEVGWIICIVLTLVLLIGNIAFIYWKRSLLPCVQYKAVHNPGNTTSL